MGEIEMHFYWRIIEELKFLGESVIFNDPCLAREYKRWLKKNAYSLSLINESKYFPLISLN